MFKIALENVSLDIASLFVGSTAAIRLGTGINPYELYCK